MFYINNCILYKIAFITMYVQSFHSDIYIVHTYIWIFGLPVCLYPINVKTAEPIGPNIFRATQMTPGKVHVPKILLVISKKMFVNSKCY